MITNESKTVFPKDRLKGMTLVEMMFSVFIGVSVLVMCSMFLLEVIRACYKTDSMAQNELKNFDVSMRLGLDTRVANGSVLYIDDAAPANYNEVGDRLGVGDRGNFLVFSHSVAGVIDSLICYRYVENQAGAGVLSRGTVAVSGANLEALLAANAFDFTVIATGLTAPLPGPNLPRTAFLNMGGGSFFMNFQCKEGADEQRTANRKNIQAIISVRG